MDDPFFAFAYWLAKQIGVSPLTIVGFFPVIVLVANFVSKLIPDDATGWRGIVRKITSILGLALANRVTSNITTTDVASIILAQRGVKVGEPKVESAIAKIEAAIPDEPEPMELDVLDPPKPLFPGVGRDPETGKFTKIQSHWAVGLLALAVILTLAGCMSMPASSCGKAALARGAAVRAIQAIDAACPLAAGNQMEGIY